MYSVYTCVISHSLGGLRQEVLLGVQMYEVCESVNRVRAVYKNEPMYQRI